MRLIDLPVKEISMTHINALISDQTTEDVRLDYKAKLPAENEKDGNGKDGNWKIKFVSDVVAMANTQGGDIVFGIGEDGDKNPQLTPLTLSCTVDETKLALLQLVRDLAEPAILGMELQTIKLDDGRYVIIMRIPRSLLRPHCAKSGKNRCFYFRTAGGNQLMDYAQIKAAFTAKGEIEEAREWRSGRFDILRKRESHLKLEPGPMQVIHSIPLSFKEPDCTFEFKALVQQSDWLCPSPGCSNQSRITADGFMESVRVQRDDGWLLGYTEFLRNGIIESVIQLESAQSASPKTLAIGNCEEDLLKVLCNFFVAQRRAGVPLPILVGLAYFDVSGYKIPSISNMLFGPKSIEPNILNYRDILLTEWPERYEDVPAVCKELIELLWNASGFETSAYIKDGKHKLEKALGEYSRNVRNQVRYMSFA